MEEESEREMEPVRVGVRFTIRNFYFLLRGGEGKSRVHTFEKPLVYENIR